MRQDFALYIGETWTIDGIVNDSAGLPVSMADGKVEFRICAPSSLIVKLTSPADILISSEKIGEYTINLDANDARQNSMAPGTFDYEVIAETADGSVSVQNRGQITLKKSLRKAFPGA